VRNIAFVQVQPYTPADIAIVRVDFPFVFQQNLQTVTLAPFGYVPPGIKRLFQFLRTNNFQVKDKQS
jgi:hypothetical protein